MKFSKSLLVAFATLFFAACATSTRTPPPVLSPPSPSQEVKTSEVVDPGYEEESEDGLSTDSEVVISTYSPTAVPANTCYWPSPEELKALSKETGRSYVLHNVCPQYPDQWALPGMRPARAKRDVLMNWVAYDCRNASDPQKRAEGKFGRTGPKYVPRGSIHYFYPASNGGVDLTRTPRQCGCGNEEDVADKADQGQFEWVTAEAPQTTRTLPSRRKRASTTRSLHAQTGSSGNPTKYSVWIGGSCAAGGFNGPVEHWFDIWRVDRDGRQVGNAGVSGVETKAAGSFSYNVQGLSPGEYVGYRANCRAVKLYDVGNAALASTIPGSCNDSRFCRAGVYVGKTLLGVALAYGTYRLFDHYFGEDNYKPPDKEPCYGHCTDQPYPRPPGWTNDPIGGNPSQPPGTPWRGQDGPGTPWTMNPNPDRPGNPWPGDPGAGGGGLGGGGGFGGGGNTGGTGGGGGNTGRPPGWPP